MTLALVLGCFPFDYEPYRPQSDYLNFSVVPFGLSTFLDWASFVEFSSALPLLDYLDAIPLYFSQTTSYLHVRLAFHRYPQIFPDYCNNHGFVPSKPFFRVVQTVHG